MSKARIEVPGWLLAGRGDPWLGVHVLSQFGFCRRAGLIEHEKNQLDSGGEADAPRENIARLFTFRRQYLLIGPMERDLQAGMTGLWRWLGGCGAALLVCLLAGLMRFPLVVLVGVCAAGYCGRRAWYFLSNLLALTRLHRRAIEAPAREPPEHFTDRFDCDWWELQKAGFAVEKLEEPLRDEALHLSGNPYRVLRRGSEVVPVFLNRRNDGANARRIFGNDRSRMAAYCLLIERAMGKSSPYGIFLYADDYTCAAVPFDDWARKEFARDLEQARSTVRSKHDPSPPEGGGNRCKGCPLGFPRSTSTPTRPGDVRLPVLPHPAIGEDGRSYHSECGDRFRWIPPHARAAEKRLGS